MKELAEGEKVLDFLRSLKPERDRRAEQIRLENEAFSKQFWHEMAMFEPMRGPLNELATMLLQSAEQMVKNQRDPSAPDTVHTPEFFARWHALIAQLDALRKSNQP
jgi:hypothetical protein